MATSFGAAAAQGLETGFGMALRGQQLEDQQKERDRLAQQQEADRATAADERSYQRGRQAKADARLARADTRQQALDELTLLDKEKADLAAEGQALWAQHGGFDKVPEPVRAGYAQRVAELNNRRAAARDAFYRPSVEKQKKEVAEKWARVQSGQMSIDDMSDDDLHKALTIQTGRPLTDFMRPKDGGASPIEQAGLDLEAGMQAGNMDLVLKAANVLFKPELSAGVGTEGRDGNEIVGKRIVKIVPHPQDPGQFVPLVEVTVKRHDGAMGKYLAPVTEDRSVYATNESAMPKSISIKDALDRVGQLQTVAAAVNSPDIRKRLDRAEAGPGAKESGDFLNALGSIGVTPPKKQITRERVDLGDRVEERTVDASGNVVDTKVLRKGAAPKAAEPDQVGAANRHFEAGLQQALARGDITAEEARAARRNHALNGSGKGTMTSPADLFKAENTLRDEHTKQSGTFVKIRDAYTKVREASKNPNAASDIALIFSYMRILDPDSVVREGEFATAEKARGVPDTVRNLYNKAINGERLNNDQRAKFVGEAKKVYDAQRKSQDKLDKTYRGLAQRYGLNAENIVQDFSLEDPAANLPQAGSAGGSWDESAPPKETLKEGHITTFKNGQKWMLQGGKPVQVQ